MRPSPSSSSSSLSMGLLASMVLVCSLSNLFVRIDFCEAQNSFVPSNQASVPNEGQDSTKIEENLLSFSNVIDWVFGEPEYIIFQISFSVLVLFCLTIFFSFTIARIRFKTLGTVKSIKNMNLKSILVSFAAVKVKPM